MFDISRDQMESSAKDAFGHPSSNVRLMPSLMAKMPSIGASDLASAMGTASLVPYANSKLAIIHEECYAPTNLRMTHYDMSVENPSTLHLSVMLRCNFRL